MTAQMIPFPKERATVGRPSIYPAVVLILPVIKIARPDVVADSLAAMMTAFVNLNEALWIW